MGAPVYVFYSESGCLRKSRSMSCVVNNGSEAGPIVFMVRTQQINKKGLKDIGRKRAGNIFKLPQDCSVLCFGLLGLNKPKPAPSPCVTKNMLHNTKRVRFVSCFLEVIQVAPQFFKLGGGDIARQPIVHV